MAQLDNGARALGRGRFAAAAQPGAAVPHSLGFFVAPAPSPVIKTDFCKRLSSRERNNPMTDTFIELAHQIVSHLTRRRIFAFRTLGYGRSANSSGVGCAGEDDRSSVRFASFAAASWTAI